MAHGLTPVTLLTGFLGSGKTTVLNKMLRAPDAPKIAVIVNEFGEVGIDDLVIGGARDLRLLANGCICCRARSDLAVAVQDLALSGRLETIQQIVVETTGLAAPAQLLHDLMADSILPDWCRINGVLCCIDAVHGAHSLDAHAEAREQAALADMLLLTKADVAAPEAADQALARARACNASAPLRDVSISLGEVGTLLDLGLYGAQTGAVRLDEWLRARGGGENHHEHGSNVATFCLRRTDPLALGRVLVAIEALGRACGQNLLRVKGVVNAAGSSHPFVVHAVRGALHPPLALPAWPSEDHSTRIVFIARDLKLDDAALMFSACCD